MESLTSRLTFDGGPWVGGFSLARFSPWAETLAGGLLGGLFVALFPSNPVTTTVGVLGWVVLSPLALLVSGLVWAVTGTWMWTLDPHLLHILGGATAGALVADLTQALSPWPFAKRLPLAAAAGLGATFLIAGLPHLLMGRS
jgi:hypothetical protein